MRKIGFPVLVLLLFGTASYALGIRLFAQYQYSLAADLIRQGRYESAVARLNTAIRFQEGASRNWKALGDAYLSLSKEKPPLKAYEIASKAKAAYLAAGKRNPIDAFVFFGLVQTERRLEMLHFFFLSGTNPHDPRPYFNTAVTLFPNNLIYYLYMADYYAEKHEKGALLKTVSTMAYISPRAYDLLKKKPYWTQEIQKGFINGLKRAIQEKKNEHASRKVIALMMEKRSR